WGGGGGLFLTVSPAPPGGGAPACAAITSLAGRMRDLLGHLGDELAEHTPVEKAAARLHEARRLDNDIAGVDAALRQAEDSLRLNPRVKEGLLFRLVLRTGLDTLEICAVVLRVCCRTLTDLARTRTDGPLFHDRLAEALRELFTHMASAVENFAVLITAQISASAEEAEVRLTQELAAARVSRERAARLLEEEARARPGTWQLYGALLAEVDRVLDELGVEKRSERLVEELDRHSRAQRVRRPWLSRLWRERPPADQ
ncbi:hypothetical protein ACFXGO_10605, partial [Streptomyces roseus]